MADQDHPVIISRSAGRSEKQDSARAAANPHLWVRLTAFLALKAPNTQDTYRSVINEWCSFLGCLPEPGNARSFAKAAELMVQANDLHAVAYREWLAKRPGEVPRSIRNDARLDRPQPENKKRGALRIERVYQSRKKDGLESTLSNATIAKKFAALRRIYRMFIGCDLGVTQNPFDTDRVPAPPKDAGRKRPTEMIDFSLVNLVIDQPERDSPKGCRDRAILAALFGGALRRSEAANLRVGDVRRTPQGTCYLYLRSTKAKRDAQQALPSWAAKIVSELLEQRRLERAGDGDYLFVSYTGRGGTTPTRAPVSESGVYKLFRMYCRRAGVEKIVSPHSARATAITRLLDQGLPHREVQEFSRHSSIQMVEVYDKRRIGVDENAARELNFENLKSEK